MTISFHQGNDQLFSSYANQPWNNSGLLSLNPQNSWDRWIIDTYGTEAAIRELFKGGAIQNAYPFGQGASKLSEYVSANETGILILKGLHQWKYDANGYRYQLHLSFGLEGRLWHLTARYIHRPQRRVVLTAEVTAGKFETAVDHEGFTRVGKKKS